MTGRFAALLRAAVFLFIAVSLATGPASCGKKAPPSPPDEQAFYRQ